MVADVKNLKRLENSFEAWRALCQEREPLVMNKKLGRYEALLHHNFGLANEFLEKWLPEECDVQSYMLLIGKHLQVKRRRRY